MPRKKPMKGKPRVNKELEGLDIRINEFGQIETNYDVDKINQFLNREVDDKKLRDRDDITAEGFYLNTYKDKKYWVRYSDEEWQGMDDEAKKAAIIEAQLEGEVIEAETEEEILFSDEAEEELPEIPEEDIPDEGPID